MSIECLSLFLRPLKIYFQNALIEFVQTLPQPGQVREVKAPLSDF